MGLSKLELTSDLNFSGDFLVTSPVHQCPKIEKSSKSDLRGFGEIELILKVFQSE